MGRCQPARNGGLPRLLRLTRRSHCPLRRFRKIRIWSVRDTNPCRLLNASGRPSLITDCCTLL
jgi:hypothetical protein